MTTARPCATALALVLAAHTATPAMAQTPIVRIAAPAAQALAPSQIANYSIPRTTGLSDVAMIGLIGVGLAALALSAAGGGDNTNTDGPDTTTPPQPPAAPGPGEPISLIQAEPEYSSNPALRSAKAAVKYAQGLSGNGVRIGVLDSGIQNSTHLRGAIDRDAGYSGIGSGYINQSDRDGLRHGTSVAQIIAGRRDGTGTYGLAYDATLVDLAILEDDTDPDGTTNNASLGAALDAGLRSGTRLFNGSFGPNDDTIQFVEDVDVYERWIRSNGLYNVYARLADNQGLLVAAAGNDGTFIPSRLAAAGLLPEFEGHILAVAAIDANDNITGFSTRCGQMRDFCLAAVGFNVPVYRDDGTRELFTGTSAAAPVVSGAIALLRQEFPELSLPRLGQIVLDTARDLGAPGVDDIYGHGALDLGGAMAPQGQLRIASTKDVRGPSHAMAESTVATQGPLAGTLPLALQGVDIMVHDAYTRGYQADLAQFVSAPFTSSPIPSIDMALGTEGGLAVRSFGEDGTMGQLRTPERTYTLGYGRADLFASAAAHTPVRKGYSPLAALEDAANGAIAWGHTGPRVGAHVDPGHGFALWGNTAIGRDTRLGAGLLREEGYVLGTRFSGAMGEGARATTAWADISTTASLGAGWQVAAQGLVSHTRFDQEGVFAGGALTAASVEVSASYADTHGNVWTGFAGTPLSIHDGHLDLDLPSLREPGTGADSTTGVLRAQQRLGLSGGKAPLDIGLRAERPIRAGHLAATAGVRVHQGTRDPFAGIAFTTRF